MDSLVVCGFICSVACVILVSQPEIRPASPALQGEFLTTGPPGKPHKYSLYMCVCVCVCVWVCVSDMTAFYS